MPHDQTMGFDHVGFYRHSVSSVLPVAFAGDAQARADALIRNVMRADPSVVVTTVLAVIAMAPAIWFGPPLPAHPKVPLRRLIRSGD